MTFIINREGHLAGAAIYGSEAGTWIDFLTLVINQNDPCELIPGEFYKT